MQNVTAWDTTQCISISRYTRFSENALKPSSRRATPRALKNGDTQLLHKGDTQLLHKGDTQLLHKGDTQLLHNRDTQRFHHAFILRALHKERLPEGNWFV